jgi:hypothetical protein
MKQWAEVVNGWLRGGKCVNIFTVPQSGPSASYSKPPFSSLGKLSTTAHEALRHASLRHPICRHGRLTSAQIRHRKKTLLTCVGSVISVLRGLTVIDFGCYGALHRAYIRR